MRKRSLVISLMAGVAFFCGGATVAQEPVQDINARVHPNLAAAQSYVVQANNFVITAQKENKWDMKGHAEGSAAIGSSKPRVESCCRGCQCLRGSRCSKKQVAHKLG